MVFSNYQSFQKTLQGFLKEFLKNLQGFLKEFLKNLQGFLKAFFWLGKKIYEKKFWREKKFGGKFFFGGKNKFWRQKFGGKLKVSKYMFLLNEGNLVILLRGKSIFKNGQHKRVLLQKGSRKRVFLQISKYINQVKYQVNDYLISQIISTPKLIYKLKSMEHKLFYLFNTILFHRQKPSSYLVNGNEESLISCSALSLGFNTSISHCF